MDAHFRACRFVYNLALATAKMRYESNAKPPLDFGELCKELTQLKKTEEGAWLNEISADALLFEIGNNLKAAYKNFFRNPKNNGFPRFKSRYDKQSCYVRCARGDRSLQVKGDTIKIPKIGFVHIVMHRPIQGTILANGSLSRTKTGEYYISIVADDGVESVPKREIKAETTVGIDFGVRKLMTLSNGATFDNIKAYEKAQGRLKFLQKRLAKRTKGSKRWEQTKMQIAKLSLKIQRQREHMLHNASNAVTNAYDTIVLEDLNVKGMTSSAKGTAEKPGKRVKQKSGLNRVILDAGFHKLKTQIQYKSEEKGKNVVFIDRFYPSSKTCSSCGTKQDIGSKEFWICTNCGTRHDRDVNAAVNIKREGLRVAGK